LLSQFQVEKSAYQSDFENINTYFPLIRTIFLLISARNVEQHHTFITKLQVGVGYTLLSPFYSEFWWQTWGLEEGSFLVNSYGACHVATCLNIKHCVYVSHSCYLV